MTRRAPPPYVVWTDRDGVVWHVYEYAIRAGTIFHPVGSGAGAYHGFLRADGERPRFAYHFFREPDLQRRDLSDAELQRQLDASDVYWQDRPERSIHPITRAEWLAGVRVKRYGSDAVDPPTAGA